MTGWLRRVGAFWYDFIVGDDWQVAVAAAGAFAVTYLVGRAGAPAWFVVPVVLVVLLPYSLWRAVRRAGRG